MLFLNLKKFIYTIEKRKLYHISSDEHFDNLTELLYQHRAESVYINAFDSSYIFNKLVSLCTKRGNKKMAYSQVVSAFLLIKQFFRIKPILLLKKAVLQAQTFIFLHKIAKGKKIKFFPRILPSKTRIHNALYIISKTAFDNSRSFRYFYISLAHAIVDNCMPNNIYAAKRKEITQIASQNKRYMRNIRKKGKMVYTKVKRKERFKLFRKMKIEKSIE